MKSPALLGALLLATTCSGCAQIESAVTFLDKPETQQAVLTLKTLATAAVCDISSAANLTATVAAQVNKAKVSSNANLVAVSAGTVCTALGGTLTGATVSNATAVTAATP